jgi:hypothetical protein
MCPEFRLDNQEFYRVRGQLLLLAIWQPPKSAAALTMLFVQNLLDFVFLLESSVISTLIGEANYYAVQRHKQTFGEGSFGHK